MKLYTFEVNKQRRIGLEWAEQIVDLPVAYAAFLAQQGPKPGQLRAIPSEMLSFVRLGSLALEAARETLAFVKRRPAIPVGEQLFYPFETVKILAPLERPGKILCSEMIPTPNEPARSEIMPQELSLFAKFPSTVIGPGAPIVKPASVEHLDFGAALAVVVGRRMKNTADAEAASSIFGYMILNDVSVRDTHFSLLSSTLSRNFDTFCPLGPCIVTADELISPQDLGLRLFLNDKLIQTTSTSAATYLPSQLLGFLSRMMTLEPGDIVTTGTLASLGSSGYGQALAKSGDVVRIEMDGIGLLQNPIANETPL